MAVVVDGARSLAPAFPRGDLLYHWGLTHGILRGELPPDGPYAGLPAYYPPGFHLLLAGASALTSRSVPDVTLALSILWLPVLPITTYALTRHLTGRSDAAVLAAALTTFGGGFDLGADRLWVNSLFLAGHEAWPLYPRDVVFGLLPLAILAYLRALEADRRGWAWAIVAGGILGVCALTQIQLLLPIPFALAAVTITGVRLDRKRLRGAAIVSAVTGGLAALAICPWLVPILTVIRRNGGVALDSSVALLPARIGFWEYPREFGLLLPLALVGAGLVLVHLRGGPTDPGDVRPASRPAPIVLIPWFAVPWLLAVLYDPSWPLEDALRPQRLWLLSSQPGAILAAIGLLALARAVVVQRWRRPGLAVPAVLLIVAAVTVPTTFATTRLLAGTWTEPLYAALRPDADGIPDLADLIGTGGPRRTVLAYEDWSSLVWYETGASVVAVVPPGYAKLAFDPSIFTGRSQATRRADVALAFGGDPAALVSVADRYLADDILLARRGDRWGIVSQMAATIASDPDRVRGSPRLVEGNGWDAVTLAPGTRLVVQPAGLAGPEGLEIRVGADLFGQAVPSRSFKLLGLSGAAARDLGSISAPPTAIDDWQVVHAEVDLRPGEAIGLEAVDELTVQSVLGFVAAAPPAGWRASVATPDAVLLERSP